MKYLLIFGKLSMLIIVTTKYDVLNGLLRKTK